MTSESTAKKLGRGVFWITSTTILVRSLGFLSTIVLARLLVPEDFGLIALATSAILLAESLTDFGFNNALIRTPNITKEHYNTAWTLNAVRGLILMVIIIALAPFAGQIFGDGRLHALLVAVAFLPFLSSLKNVKFTLFEKQVNYQKEFLLLTTSKTVSVALTVLVAIIYRNYWALVVGMLAGRTVQVIGSYYLIPYRPAIHISKYKELFGFSVWLMLTQLVYVLSSRMFHVVISKSVGNASLGYYHIGTTVTGYLTTDLVGAISRALFPTLAGTKANQQETRIIFLRSLSVTLCLAVPVGFGFAATAADIVRLVLGAQWGPAVPVIQFISPVMPLLTISSLVFPLTMAANKNHRLLLRELLYFALRIGAVTIGVKVAGFHGILHAALWSGLIIFALNFPIAARLIGTSVWKIFMEVWRPIAAGVLMSLLIVYLSDLLPAATTGAEAALRLALLIPLGAATYISSLFGFWSLQSKPAGIEAEAIAIIRIKLLAKLDTTEPPQA